MKVLFIGLGSIGQRHLTNLLMIMPNIDLYALRTNRNSKLINKFKEFESGTPLNEAFEIIEISDLEKNLHINFDLIFITNPSSLHLKFIEKSLKTNAKIFVEKPLSHELNNIDKLIKFEKEIGFKKIAVGYQYRFHPAILETKKIVESGELGNIISASFYNGEYLPEWHPYEDYRLSYASQNKLGGGSLLTQIHEFDMVVNFFNLPKKLFAIGGHLSSLEIDVEDTVQVLMECELNKKPFPVNVSLNYLNWPPKKEFTIIGENGNIFCDLIDNKLSIKNRISSEKRNYHYKDFDRNQMFIEEIKSFLQFVNEEKENIVDLKEGIKSLEIALKAKESLIDEKICYFQ